MSDRKDKAVAIPNRSRVPSTTSPDVSSSGYELPGPNEGGDFILSYFERKYAERRARELRARATALDAERSLVETRTQFRQAYNDDARAKHEQDELPEILKTDRLVRRKQRAEIVREAYHQADIAEQRRVTELTEGEHKLTVACTGLVQARQELTTAQQGLLNAQQAYEAQLANGDRFHELTWVQKINDLEMSVEEQQVVLTEHRQRRIAQAGRPMLVHSSEEKLLERRAELNADGHDTRAVEAELERVRTRK